MPPPTRIDPCANERALSDDAIDDFRDASNDREEAQDDLEDAKSFFDESTWANVGAAGGVALACATTPVGWVTCGIGIVLGGATFVGSEVDRAGDIEAAEKALARAERDYWKANDRFQRAMRAEMHCRLHNQLTGQPA